MAGQSGVMDAIDEIQDVFRVFVDRPCLISISGQALTYGEVERRAVTVAERLVAEGAKPGNVILMLAGNSVELAITMLGAWTAGCIVAAVNPELGAEQITEIVTNADPRLILATAATAKLGATLASARATVLRFIEPLLQEGPGGTCDGACSLVSKSSLGVSSRIFEHLRPNEPFLIVYTAGSTGTPKGIQIAPEQLVRNERLFCREMGITEANRFYNFLPMSYLGGVHNLLLLPLSVGASVVIDAPLGSSNLFVFWRRVRERQIDTLWLTGAMLAMLLKLSPRDDESWIGGQVRLGLVGMAPLQIEVQRRFEERFGFRLHQNYALSETLFLTSQRPDRSRALGGNGQLLPGIEIMVRDQTGQPTAAGGEGELFIRTPYMMCGYRRPSGVDAVALKDGIFRTGDLGFFDDAGELHISGRVKDLIIRGGLNISPSLVERAIAGHSAVAEVAVVGVPDAVYGEEVVAVVVVHAGELSPGTENSLSDAIRSHAAQSLAVFERPKRVLIWPSLPRNHANKIDKPAIRLRLGTSPAPGLVAG